MPAEIADYDNQFSGTYLHNDKLYLLSESRLQDSAEAKLYAIKLTDIEHKFVDTTYVLPFEKINIIGLDLLRDKMRLAGQEYEGLEAIVIKDNTAYLSVETTTPSAYCYLLKGALNNYNLVLDTSVLIPLKKPRTKTGESIYNAGFESVCLINEKLYAFYEYNYFSPNNYVYSIDLTKNYAIDSLSINKLPFRITDITAKTKQHFTALNFFYNGEKKDTVYRMPRIDIANDKLIRNDAGYHHYASLLDVKFTGKKFKWKTLWEFPPAYWGYNFECITAYKNGYFILNDKYTPRKPYSSTLLYLKPI